MQKSEQFGDRARMSAPWFLQLSDEEGPGDEETDLEESDED
jgi:hypothetical protein